LKIPIQIRGVAEKESPLSLMLPRRRRKKDSWSQGGNPWPALDQVKVLLFLNTDVVVSLVWNSKSMVSK